MTVDDVGVACGAGTDCGSCRGMIEDMIDEHFEADVSRVDACGRMYFSVSRFVA